MKEQLLSIITNF